MNGTRNWSLILVLIFPVLCQWTYPEPLLQGGSRTHDHPLGRAVFPISCAPHSQERFETGLALLHHMMYEQAEEEFRGVAKNDPGCGMAYWGIAMGGSATKGL